VSARCGYLGDPVLRTPADRVTRFDDSLASLIEDLLDTVQLPGRAGLAANQIGSSLDAFSYNLDGQLGYLINARIVEAGGEIDDLEACLSIPGVSVRRRRAAAIVVCGVDLEQRPVTVSARGELAKCLQHETDHLRGLLIIDGLEDGERRRVMREISARQLANERLADERLAAGPGGALLS
jgi:peptide deformylase